jgi:hypothetical protein
MICILWFLFMYTTQAYMYGFINQSHSDNTCNLTCATWEGELYNGFVWNDQITTLDMDNPICKFLSTTSAIQEDTCHAPPIECADDPCHTGICLFDPVHVFKCDCSLTYFQGLYCQIDPCKIKHCLNNGVCQQGVCQCVPGFEGEICEIIAVSPVNPPPIVIIHAPVQEEDGLNIVIPISIGSAVLVIIIISVLVYFFVCKRKKDPRITRRMLHPYTKLEF